MSRKHLLNGLVKWAQGDQWHEAFEVAITQHLGPACDEMDVEIEDLADLLEPLDLMKSFNCAFEDLASTDIEGKNLIEDYLKRRGWKETASTRAYMRSLRDSVTSIYEVGGIRREEGFFLRDVIRGGEPFWVHEKSETRVAAEGNRIAVRVVTVNGRVELGGTVLPLERSTAAELAAELLTVSKATSDDIAEAFAAAMEESGQAIDEEIDEVLDALRQSKIELILDETLAASAFMFTMHFLREKLGEKLADRSELRSVSNR